MIFVCLFLTEEDEFTCLDSKLWSPLDKRVLSKIQKKIKINEILDSDFKTEDIEVSKSNRNKPTVKLLHKLLESLQNIKIYVINQIGLEKI